MTFKVALVIVAPVGIPETTWLVVIVPPLAMLEGIVIVPEFAVTGAARRPPLAITRTSGSPAQALSGEGVMLIALGCIL